MAQYIQKLPAVFQTVTEKKFFDATFDQVFSKKDSDLLVGYLGRRIPGRYNPISDFYIPEPNKDRTWWQLEATAFAKNEDLEKENIFFYEDLLNKIKSLGGNILNQDRLFESEYYSWGPPIDYDMFINYQNYFWVEEGLNSITITGVLGSDIVGQASYTTPALATPPNLKLTTGMVISLPDDPLYPGTYTVENIGNCIGIRLVAPAPDFTAGTAFEFLPWDGVIELSTGRIIQDTNWDILPWDTQVQPGNADYITIERGSRDRNAWSRTNHWVHIDAINATIAATGTPFPIGATRALRPIIQFIADLPLFNSGTNFLKDINYGFRNDVAGLPILFANVQGQLLSSVNSLYSIDISNGDFVAFFNDNTSLFDYWDELVWDLPPDQWDSNSGKINQYIFEVQVLPNGTINFIPNPVTPVADGDIVFILEDAPYNGAKRGETWYYENATWLQATNDKVTVNQPPLFQLYDHNGVKLNDAVQYPRSTFNGSKIFSYKVNTTPGATVDPVLRFPIVYTSLGQSSDIIFQNNLITDRYVYGTGKLPISGYYYYTAFNQAVLYNNWNMYSPCPCDDITPPPPCNCISVSKQRVIDRFTVGYGSEYQFKLSVTPYGYPATPDIVVNVNGVEIKSLADQTNGYVLININGSIYVDLEDYLTTLLLTPQSQPPVVEVDTYTWDNLDPDSKGYFEIPQQLDANPGQLEISEISASNLIDHFSSIVRNQIGFTGTPFGGSNNYRDSRKNRTVGSFILQNLAPALKSMLVSSSDDLDVIKAIRFSQDEYTKFKNKFLSTALQLINTGFNPVQYHNNTIVVSAWFEEILKTVNVSKEFSNAFAYSYMIANGGPAYTELKIVPVGGIVTLTNFVDINLPQNALYIYKTSSQEKLLIRGIDFTVISSTSDIEIQINTATVPVGTSLLCALYKDAPPAYIPSTPSKLGLYNVYVPQIVLDPSYAVPTNVIIGHDGSRTIAYGDYRDKLLLELETRIYNLLQPRFRNQYSSPLPLESVKSGYFRQTRYTRNEYLNITEQYLNKWSAKNKVNYRVNEWESFSAVTSPTDLWKLYNYSDAVNAAGTHLNLPGNWKGIFQYYYDTYRPNTHPWEMLGFTSQPVWWVSYYGSNWSSTNAALWNDLEAGIIRQGPRAIYDPITLQPQPQMLWARPGLSSIIPVDNLGQIIPVPTLFNVAVSGNIYEPFDGFDKDWVYGDGAPAEQAWMSTSGYVFSIQEFLYLMKPGPFGELCWDTTGTTLSPGRINIPGVNGPVKSTTNWQYVQNNIYTSSDPEFLWFRPKNKDQYVHAEPTDLNVPRLRFGYQTWISDRILFLGKSITSTFGQKIRTLDVNLANKFAGFTNKDTIATYIESITPGASTSSLLIPTNNFEVKLHKGPPVKTYSYSGVVIRALADGTFAVYGYDLLNSAFTVLDRSNAQLIDVTIGGTPAEFKIYSIGETYNTGDIVRYNGVYYVSRGTFVAGKFDIQNWQKLAALPINGGVSVTYKPISEVTSTTVPYGSVLKTAQDVFDFLIGWGAYLESQGWKFDEVSQDTNQVSDWLYSAKQFLFWLNTSWAPDASIQLSPAANSVKLVVEAGYPDDVEVISNGIYSILDKFGVAISPANTITDRDGPAITVAPASLAAGGIYFLQVHASEIEHVLIFDNTTSFNDVIYSPLLRSRQQRLRFNGFRSNGWYGKMEAPGYLVISDQLVPNYDTIVNSMRYYYDPDVTIDNPSLEDLGRHLIGFESKSYLDELQVTNDVQYLFYQGAIRQKGTIQAFDKLFRSTKVKGHETISVYEEWALKLSDFGNTIEQVSTEFVLHPEQNSGEVIVARLNYKPSELGHVRLINIFNAETSYTRVPSVVVALPDAAPVGWEMFSILDTYQVGSIVKKPDSFGNPVYYSSNIVQGPGPFIPANWTVIMQTRRAKAYIVLDSTGKISRVDVTDGGYGYLFAPDVTIDAGAEDSSLDKLYSVWQGDIIRDTSRDNIIEIDIDDTDLWTVRPPEPQYTLTFPTTDNIEYAIPNAGYVNFNDVTWASFNVPQTTILWGTADFNPVELDTVWVAKDFLNDWNVYKMVNITPGPWMPNQWKVTKDEEGNLLLLTAYDIKTTLGIYTPESPDPITGEPRVSPAGDGNAILTPVVVNGAITSVTITNAGTGYSATDVIFAIRGAEAVPSSIDATFTLTVGGSGEITSVTVVTQGSGYQPGNLEIIPQYYNSTGVKTDFGNLICLQVKEGNYVNPETNFAVGFTSNGLYTDPLTLVVYNSYSLITLEGTPITADDISIYESFTDLLIFKGMRWTTTPNEPTLPAYVGVNDLIWVDDIAGKWAVIKIQSEPGLWDSTYWDVEVDHYWKLTAPLSPASPINVYGWDVTGPFYFAEYRVQESLINTKYFESANIFHTRTASDLAMLPIYDPFKQILPGLAAQNISYLAEQDPARYNVTGDQRLFSENITFGRPQVGKLWWDLSSVRYVYYEQPKALDGSESNTDNLVYRRNHWGQIFPGSTIDIYEWTQSDVPPSEYTGTGTPRSLTDYVQIVTSNRFTNITEVKYYFWVLNATDKPNIQNRTLAAIEVSRLLASPISQGFSYFAPIQQTENNNSYMFYNVQEILAYKGDNVQIQYKVSDRDDQKHTQWALYREGDKNSLVAPQFWDKMVDSLCGYTKVLPRSDEWYNSILWEVYGWDIDQWDVAEWDSPDLNGESYLTASVFGEILPVPDPSLSEAEKFGITYRPRQGMFVQLYNARKVFVQSANALLSRIPIRDTKPSWNEGVITQIYWKYTTWYEVGFENVTPTVVFSTPILAQNALAAGQLTNGTIVEVTDGTGDGRFVLYNVVQLNPNIPTQSFEQVAIQNSAIELLDLLYTQKNIYQLSVELRQLLNAFRTQVFVDSYIIDQNELFFSLLNYVMSEQRNPNWLFKSSYIYVKENNVPLTQDQLYTPDQVDNIIKYIVDAKPYHTQIRDYTSSYVTTDIAPGVPVSIMNSKTTLTFNPGSDGNISWDTDNFDIYGWDELNAYAYATDIIDAGVFDDNLQQFVSPAIAYTISLTFYDASKVGYSSLFPYTFDFNSINLDNPQTFITPENIVRISVGSTLLYYGVDYYVEYNTDDENYTVYFFNNPGSSPAPVAYVFWDGNDIMRLKFNSFRNELGLGFPYQDFVVNVDTMLPVNNVSGTLHPYAPWGTTVSGVDPLVASVIVAAGGSAVYNPGDPVTLQYLPTTISFKQNLNIDTNNFFRNALRYQGTLVSDVAAPTAETEHLDAIVVFVDPATHPITTDILPDPGTSTDPGVIWIGGERIEYRSKTLTAANTWTLKLVRRGTKGTAPTAHNAMIPSLANPLVLVPNPVFVDENNTIPGTPNTVVWNATNANADLSTIQGGVWDEPAYDSIAWDIGVYTSITSASAGGLWYANTTQSQFLKTEIGKAIP